MSALNAEHTNRYPGQSNHTLELPTPILKKLNKVIRQTWRAELLYRLALAAAMGLLTIIGLIAGDMLLGLRWTPIRWAIWVAGFGSAVGAVRYLLLKPLRRNEELLHAAWKIESSHPGMEERLTSTVQFLKEDSSQHASPELIDALMIETAEGVSPIDTESIPTQSSLMLIIAVGALASALVLSIALWPKSVLTSLDNLATPWSPYLTPTLSANISPGDVTIAEGESVIIEVKAADALDHPELEIIRGDTVESHLMVATSPESSTFTLTDVREDAVYRIHSDHLYSVPHTITVHPQPKLKAITGHLKFPDYTHLEPLMLKELMEPIDVPAGTEVTLTATCDDIAVTGAIHWNSERQEVVARKVPAKGSADSVQFEWTFRVEPKTKLFGTLDVQSEHGVRSLPHPVEIRALEDLSPTIKIVSPALRQLAMRRDEHLPIRYRVIEDFGVSKVELIASCGTQELVTRTCPAPERQPGEPRVSVGETSLALPDVPADCHELRLWLRIADNRPEEFGGVQVIESEEIHITLDDRADSMGQQQILAERQMIELSIGQAIEQIREAAKAAEALLKNQAATDGPHGPLAANESGLTDDETNTRADHIKTLRQETSNAKQTLDQLARRLQDESNLFQPKAAEIQHVADKEVSEAMELANDIPLTDDQSQQDVLARGAEKLLDSAVDQLEQLNSDIDKQAAQMDQAAQLDDLAAKQERLARKAAEGDQESVPDEQWRDRQQQVADELQSLVEESEEALGQQLLQRAEDAEQLAKQAQRLAQHQRQLEQAMRDVPQNPRKPEEAQRQLQNLIAAENDEINRQAKQLVPAQDDEAERAGKEAVEMQQQRMDEAAEAAKEGDLDKAAAKLQEQIAERAEKLQQQAQQLAKHENPEPAIHERAKQAAEQLQQAKQKADQANQTLCEKCTGGGQNMSDGQNSPEGQNKAVGQNPEPDGRDRASKANNQNPEQQQQQQQQQGAAQPNDADQRRQASEQNDAKLNRDQQDAAQALQQASQSLNLVCEACRECASRNKPGSGGAQSASSTTGGSPKSGQASGAKQLAKASDGAAQAARSSTNEEAAQTAGSVAKQINQLADDVAQDSGYSLRKQTGSPQEQDKQPGTDNKPDDKPRNNAHSGQPGQASEDPQGVGNAAGDASFTGQKLRGGSNSNWTRARQKLRGGVLDDREGNVPEQYRGIVERYFEELSRQQSSQEE